MKRRNFIKIMVAGSGVILVPSIFNGCGGNNLKALEAWNGPSENEKDIRILVLSYAILAPNPHNKQPWIIELRDPNRFDLYVDSERLLPETDPPYRQIHIGQGTFLENLDLAAKHFGYQADIEYFPQGMYSNAVLENKPVATINLVKNSETKRDPLFDYILERESNKRAYKDKPLSQKQLISIKEVVGRDAGGYFLAITTGSTQLTKLAGMLSEAMRIETSDKNRDRETITMFRFNDDEVEKYKDGFGLAQVGKTGIIKFLLEKFFLSRKSALTEDSSFGEETVKLTEKQSESAVAFGWLTSKTNTRLDQVKIGRIYERINLKATELGIAMHPMSQVLQEYSDMAFLQQKFKDYLRIPEDQTVQMLFRLGHATPVVHSPRRQVKDFFRG